MSKISKRSEIVMPTRREAKLIIAAARLDPDAQPMTARQLKEVKPLAPLRGRPKLQNPKQLVSIRYSAEVIEYFRATGEGWQVRMDDVLRDYVARQAQET